MQLIEDVMTQNVISISPQEALRRAAELMDDLNVGALPVCDGPRLVGMLTDRDIVVRAVAEGLSPDEAKVGEVMSASVHCCFIDQPVDEVLEMMGDLQIRRLPVCDRGTGNLIGIVSLGDMATRYSAGMDHTLENISFRAQPDRLRSGQY